MNGSNQLVQKLWNFCNVLRGDASRRSTHEPPYGLDWLSLLAASLLVGDEA